MEAPATGAAVVPGSVSSAVANDMVDVTVAASDMVDVLVAVSAGMHGPSATLSIVADTMTSLTVSGESLPTNNDTSSPGRRLNSVIRNRRIEAGWAHVHLTHPELGWPPILAASDGSEVTPLPEEYWGDSSK
jgi:hypothetical protein